MSATVSRLLMLALDEVVLRRARLHVWDHAGRRLPGFAINQPGLERDRIIREHFDRAHVELLVPLSAIWPGPEERDIDLLVSKELDARVRKSLEAFICGQLGDLGDGRFRVCVSRRPW